VVKRRERRRFVAEPLGIRGPGSRGNRLQGDGASGDLEVLREVDDSEASPAQLAQHAEVRDARPRRERESRRLPVGVERLGGVAHVDRFDFRALVALRAGAAFRAGLPFRAARAGGFALLPFAVIVPGLAWRGS